MFKTAWKFIKDNTNGKKRIIGGVLLALAGAPFLDPATQQILYWAGSSVFGIGAAHAYKKEKGNEQQRQ